MAVAMNCRRADRRCCSRQDGADAFSESHRLLAFDDALGDTAGMQAQTLIRFPGPAVPFGDPDHGVARERALLAVAQEDGRTIGVRHQPTENGRESPNRRTG